MKNIDGLKVGFTAVFAAVTGWLGVLAWPFYFLLLTNLIDYVTGIMAAVRRGEKVNRVLIYSEKAYAHNLITKLTVTK